MSCLIFDSKQALTPQHFEARLKHIRLTVRSCYSGWQLLEIEINHLDFYELIEAHGIIHDDNSIVCVVLHGTTIKSAMHVTASELKISLYRPSEVICHAEQL